MVKLTQISRPCKWRQSYCDCSPFSWCSAEVCWCPIVPLHCTMTADNVEAVLMPHSTAPLCNDCCSMLKLHWCPILPHHCAMTVGNVKAALVPCSTAPLWAMLEPRWYPVPLHCAMIANNVITLLVPCTTIPQCNDYCLMLKLCWCPILLLHSEMTAALC